MGKEKAARAASGTSYRNGKDKGSEGIYRELIMSRRWRELRKWKLGQCPVCHRCSGEGRIAPATEVHHRVPVEHGVTRMDKEALMFNPENLEALCHSCHVARHVEMGRSGKAASRRIREAQGEELRKRFYGE